MKSLDKCRVGDEVIINDIYAGKSMKRRLLDIGLIPGTIVKVVLRSPSGDPYAFDIRGSIIAIRKEDTKKIIVEDCYE